MAKEEQPSEELKEEVKGKQKEVKKKTPQLLRAVPAEVLEIIGRVGGKHTATQVRCKVLDGSDSGKVTRRNVLGPVRIGDVLMLTQTEMEATPLRGGRR